MDELVKMLDIQGEIWLIRPDMTIYPTLRAALQKTYELSKKGVTSQIILLPEDKLVLEAGDIHALWERLGLVKEPVS